MKFHSLKCPHCGASPLELGLQFFNENKQVIYFCLACSKPIPVNAHYIVSGFFLLTSVNQVCYYTVGGSKSLCFARTCLARPESCR